MEAIAIIEDKLPDKISDLLEMALRDLEQCEFDGRYTVEMNVWHMYVAEDHQCSVCLGGALLALEYNLNHEVDYSLADIKSESVRKKLLFLDMIRKGFVNLEDMNQRERDAVCNSPALRFDEFTPYEKSPDKFKAFIRNVIRDFKELGA